MEYQVLLFKNHEGEYAATVPVPPGCTSHGRTEEEAIATIRETITELQAPASPQLPDRVQANLLNQ